MGDKLLLYSGEQVEVTEMEKKSLAKPIKVYNFEVEDWHTYFVSKGNVLVHNKAMSYVPKNIDKIKDSFLKRLGFDAHKIKVEALNTNKGIS